MPYTRITVDPHRMGGVPYPDLEPDDIREAIHYAAEAVRERELPLTGT